MKLYAINGISLAGKDSFFNRVKQIAENEHNLDIEMVSTIDPIKDLYKNFFGWNGEKTDYDRKTLNELKQLWIKKCNGPSKWLVEQIKSLQKQKANALFVMVREYDELLQTIKIGKELCEDTKSIVIVRNGLYIPPIEAKILDTFPFNFKYDIKIYNRTTKNPDIPNLWKSAKQFVEQEFL